MNRKTLEKMSEIEEFLDRIVTGYEDKGALHFELTNVEAMYAYASSLVRWEKEGFNHNDFFSTDNKLLLRYAKELWDRFRLSVLDRKGGEDQEQALKELMPVFRKDVSKDFLN